MAVAPLSKAFAHCGTFTMSDDSDRGLAPNLSPVAELAADPQAPRWARDCAWVPGTGHCRNHPCGTSCLFRAQRKAEAERVMRSRQRRRLAQEAFASRMVRRVFFFSYSWGTSLR